ncbi:MAG: M20/M25/M40 family metallo-hydrolase [Woeseia sp.]|nr:M20/M25/M40 family metallo-hydrolase [Woeseia sp.]NNE61667.1 M20/M25/M40 family metallo-hydrolase [Woeseia sp.]NNL55950.1 M20/M25/M40 family metallo-hydrolase [Woeseia sp.]
MRKLLFLFLLQPTAIFAQGSALIDWDAIGDESIRYLVDLVRIDTSNPPGNETMAVNYVKEVLAKEGIPSEIYALDPSRANLVARYKGNGSKRPLLIMGHTDVVGVQADKWTEPPFGGLRKDGYIWGRGTLDDKDNLTAGLIVMLMLHRLDIEMDRDIILLAESGEEGTPDVGINFMVENHWDAIAAEYAIAEGGSKQEVDGHVHVVGVQTTEKLPRRATLVARGTAGHGSRPRNDNAVTMIAEAVARAGRWQTPVRLNSTTNAYFERLAELADGEEAFRYRNVQNPEYQADIDAWFRDNDPFHYSSLRTSVVPTIIDAGFRKNVIPSEAKAVLDIRMLPDEDVDEFYRQLAAVIDNPAIEIVPEDIYRPAALPSAIDNEMFEVIETVAKRMYPDSTTLPVMATGATDMAQLRAKGTEAYGIGPKRTLEEMNSRFGAHSDDERISEESLKEMVRFLWNIVIEIGAAK